MMSAKLHKKEVLALLEHPTHIDIIKDKLLQSKREGEPITDLDLIYSREYDI